VFWVAGADIRDLKNGVNIRSGSDRFAVGLRIRSVIF
jgi:hypothetical protein